jgi:hypothetical protein
MICVALPYIYLACATFLLNFLTHITKSPYAVCCLPGCALWDTGNTFTNHRLQVATRVCYLCVVSGAHAQGQNASIFIARYRGPKSHGVT